MFGKLGDDGPGEEKSGQICSVSGIERPKRIKQNDIEYG